MKKITKIGIVCIIIGLIFILRNDIVNIFYKIIIKFDTHELRKNIYYRDYDFLFVQNTDNFNPETKQDLYNIYYTVINSGEDSFSFYCSRKYKNCIDEVKEVANDRTVLSDINNYVHPFNSFKKLETQYNNYGKITINITHTYTDNQINEINDEIDKVVAKTRNQKNLSTVEKIKTYHDYIINSSTYDSNRSDRNIVNYQSDIAYGPLIQGYGICGGYTDAMMLFLEELDVKSFRVSSSTHVWNAVLINGNWLHLDLTWDDPITSNGENIIDDNFFLITTKKLLELEKTQHDFDQNIYKELKTN